MLLTVCDSQLNTSTNMESRCAHSGDAIPDDVFCFMGDSDRATQVMAVATLFRVVVDSGCSRSIICHEHAFVPGTLDLSKRPRIWMQRK